MGVKIVLNREGIRELLSSEWAAGLCREVADGVAARAGDGYETAAPHQTGQRVAVNVYPATPEAARDNSDNNTLFKALGG